MNELTTPIIIVGLMAGLFIFVAGLAWAWLLWKRPGQPSQEMSQEEREAARQEQEEAKQELQADKVLFRAIAREARYLAKHIPNHLAIQNRMVHNFQDSGRRGRRHRRKTLIQFEAILLTRNEIWFKFNGRRLPYGTSFSDIKNPDNHVIENLQYAIGRPCRFHEDFKYNLFLRVGLRQSLLGIPKYVKWNQIVSELPKDRPYAVLIGVNENSKAIYEDISRWPHVIITGGTNMGKSTQLKQWLITLLQRNSPDSLRFCFVDLKRVELPEFKDLPHTIHHADRPENVQEVFEWLEGELYRRLDRFTGVCTDIIGWNRQRPDKLPRIFLVIDELATITTDRNLKRKALDSIINLARLGRAAGIHLILCTQTVSKEVLPMDVLANVQGRVTFSLANVPASTLVIGNSLAVGLAHPGRAVYVDGSEYVFCQAPIATEEEISQVLEAVRGGARPDSGVFDVEDVFKVILYNLGGHAGWREVYEAAGGQLGEKRVKSILREREFDPLDPNGSIIELDGRRYILTTGRTLKGAPRSRRLLAINGRIPQSLEEMEQLIGATGPASEDGATALSEVGSFEARGAGQPS